MRAWKVFDDDAPIKEKSFDEVAREDTRPPDINAGNALNELHFALHKVKDTRRALHLVNAIAELEMFLQW